MPLLLNIDTATEHASVCISKGTEIIGMVESTEQKNHASFIQPAIQDLLKKSGLQLSQFDAIACTAGPGSYTGLRVGMASAKGICFALEKPLILVNTLEVIGQSVLSDYLSKNTTISPNTLICPLIDARRLEVFTALYQASLQEIEPPHALILDETSFSSLLITHPIIFCGSGILKLKGLVSDQNAIYSQIQHNASHLAKRALIAYQSKSFANLAYSEPLYVKEFFNPTVNKPHS